MNDEQKRTEELRKENEIKHPDHRTLADIFHDDKTQVAEIYKNCKRVKLQTKEATAAFHWTCMAKALESVGVKDARRRPEVINGAIGHSEYKRATARIFDELNVRFEKRIDNESPWRSGYYIYKNNDLAYFISLIMEEKAPVIISMQEYVSNLDYNCQYAVVTNVDWS